MENNALYKLLKQIAEGYTVDQVEGVTKAQIEALLNTSGLSDAFVDNMKRQVANYLQGQIDIANFEQLRSTAVSWLADNFPDAEFEKGRESGKSFVKIWLEGKP